MPTRNRKKSSAPDPAADDAKDRPSPGSKIDREPGDVGVPMLAGHPDERQGPEDALGEGPKRGNYKGRVDPLAHEGDTPQAPRADDIGDEAGLKGGVETAPPVEVTEQD